MLTKYQLWEALFCGAPLVIAGADAAGVRLRVVRTIQREEGVNRFHVTGVDEHGREATREVRTID